MNKPDLCIYHGNCADGFGAAWCVHERYRRDGKGVDFHPGVYGQEPPDVAGRHVLMVDFSYKRPVLEEMAGKALSILILDHHKTAEEDLKGFPKVASTWREHIAWRYQDNMENAETQPYVLFDMARSGAGITWDYLFPDERRPKLIDHIEDRDLWRFALDGTREIQAAVFSYPYDFEVWDRLMLGEPRGHRRQAVLDELRIEGAAIERKHHKDVAELVEVCKRRMVIGGHDVPVASLPYTLTSDAGHLMAQDEPFAACYWDTPGGRVFSLRSTDDGLDVSEIAKSYGGGGHRNASGFQMPIGWEGDERLKVRLRA